MTLNYWNREESTPLSYSTDTAPETATTAVVTRPARILSLSSADNPAILPLHQGDLPEGADLLAIGTKLEEFDVETLKLQKPNVVFVGHGLVRTVGTKIYSPVVVGLDGSFAGFYSIHSCAAVVVVLVLTCSFLPLQNKNKKGPTTVGRTLANLSVDRMDSYNIRGH
jgi:hypothetical protein